MPFLKSFRNSVSRKNVNSSKNNTSVVTIGRSGGSFRHKSEKSYIAKGNQQTDDLSPEGILRSNTFTIKNEDSILVKVKSQSKATNMFGKLGSLGRKKKQATQQSAEKSSSNTYKSWPYPNEPANVAHNDPFAALYTNGSNSTVAPPTTKGETLKPKPAIDHGTYRKSKLPSAAKEQLEQIRDVPEPTDDSDKFKTVTINSFRKSFREKFLAAKKAPHNPAWFIEVEAPPSIDKGNQDDNKTKAEKLVFQNENYRPNARSPVREMLQPTPKPRTSVKRNETFRVERESAEPSIRIEIKNSIAPHEPSRLVPVGVAKPIPNGGQQLQPSSTNIVQKTWTEPGQNTNRNLYQTTIQISGDSTYPVPKPRTNLNPSLSNNFKRNYTPGGYTKIQINDGPTVKGNFINNSSPLTSYGMLKNLNQSNNSTTNRSNGHGKAAMYQERDNSPVMERRKWNRSPSPTSSSSSKRKTMQATTTYSTGTENSTRREAFNVSRMNANSRRPLVKAPWR